MLSKYRNYENLYPGLIVEILEYFSIATHPQKPIAERSVLKFCEQSKEAKTGTLIYQPDTVDKICKKLCDKGIMNAVRTDGGLGLYNNYMYLPGDTNFFSKERDRLKYYFNSMVYGFEYIYNMYKDIVVPLIWQTSETDCHMGTGFRFLDGIVTARHCVEDVTGLQIKGYTGEQLNNCKVYVDENPGVDIAFIHTGELADPILYAEAGLILQEVLVMGYPVIPTFTDFLTAEKATISSKAESRLIPTKGAIAAYGDQYMEKVEAMLITAKIRGGNSGGPIINENGCLVGVACRIPDYENNQNGFYDDLGYGIALPIRYASEIIANKSHVLDRPKDFFKDFV